MPPPPSTPSDIQDQDAAKDALLESVARAHPDQLADTIADVHPAQLADLLEAMPPERRVDVWSAADADVRGETLTELHDEVLAGLAGSADTEHLAAAVAPLQPDEIADLEPHLPPAALEAALARLDPRKRRRLEHVRRHPEDVAGGLMDVDAVTVNPQDTLSIAMERLRDQRRRGEGPSEHLNSLFVVDGDHRLLGVIALADVVSYPPESRVEDVMSPATGLPVDMPAREVIAAFRDRDLLSAPVVSDEGMVLGRITVDDVLDAFSEEAERSILAPAGLDEDKDLFAPLRTTLAHRGPWLLTNLAGAFLAAWVIGRFEHTIEQLVALAVLMPVVASMGGVAGQQSLALIIRGLALNQVGRSNRWRLLRHEMANGAALGLLFAALVAGVAHAWYGMADLTLIIGAALTANVFIGISLGTLYPIVLKRLNIDPALAGGMALTVTTDVLGFFSLLGLGTLLLL